MIYSIPLRYQRYIYALLMILIMVGCAEGLAEREIIFPEMAALAIGMWVVDKRVWHCNKWKMLLAMSLCSVTGVLIVRYSPFPLLVNIALAFSFAAIHLTLSRTTLIPQVSAIILPVLLKTDSWVYPAAVIIMSLIIILGQHLMEKKQFRTPIEYTPVKISWRPALLSWTFLLFTVLSVTSLAIYTDNIYFILPPLIVTYIEFAHSKAGFRNRPVQILLTLLAASLLGSLCQWFGYYQWHLPESLIALCITGSLFLLFELSGKPFAPAGAVALIPLLLPREDLLWLPIQVFIGATLFIGIAMLCFQKCYNWTRPQLIICFLPAFIRNLRKHKSAEEKIPPHF